MRVAQMLVVLTCLVGVPTSAWAQATIAGAVRDSSGAILPGVTVEATSPALIEKVRTAVTDGSGRYRIEDLRPGRYRLTFTLPGFVTLVRDEVEVRGASVFTVDGELTVGGVQETITVSGETPVVDTTSTRREITLDNETLRAIPSVRSYSSLIVTVPGVQTDRNNVPTGPLIAIFPINGGRGVESRLHVDGLNVGNAPGGNQPSHYVADIGNAEEVVFTTSGGLGESETAGLTMNVVPRTGGNRLSGQVFFSGFTEGMQADNFDEELSRQVAAPNPLRDVYDLNVAVGGPILRDRLWYFVSARTQGQERDTLNLYYNTNAGDPNAWTYQPDVTRPAYSDRTWESINGRITLQAGARNKFSVFWDEQWICRKCTGTTSFSGSPAPTTSPEADGFGDYFPQRTQQVKWTSPATSRLLLEAGVGTSFYQWGNRERPDNETRDLERVFNIGDIPISEGVSISNVTYRSQNWMEALTNSVAWTATASYVTGAHSMKFGYQGNWWRDDRTMYMNNTALSYTFLNMMPISLTQNVSPFTIRSRAMQTSLYVQEQWTLGNVTLQGALRYDNPWSWFPEQQVGPTRFFPNAVHFDRQDGVTGYHDLTPRMGLAWDVFGTGRTALKVNLGKYLQGASSSNLAYNANPVLRIPFGSNGFGIFNPNVTRDWTDGNGDFRPDCDLLDPQANGECSAINNLAFGSDQLVGAVYDPEYLRGWGVRPSDWAFGLSVQQQIFPRASVEIAYNRRWFDGFTYAGGVTDNLAVTPDSFDPYCITAPVDSRLPDGGGYPVCTLYNVKPESFGVVDQLITDHRNYGEDSRVFDGISMTFNVRPANGLTFQGGPSIGKTVTDYCEIRAALPETSPTNPYCRTETPWLTQFRGLAAYTIPTIDVLLSAVYQDKPGSPGIDASLNASYTLTPAEVTDLGSQIGRPLTPVGALTVNLLDPGTLYGDRIRQLDVSVKKILRFGATRTTIGVDLYNVLNSNVTLTYNNAFAPGGDWLTPTEVMTARVARVNAEFSW